jgi:phage baseplate assembly protein W
MEITKMASSGGFVLNARADGLQMVRSSTEEHIKYTLRAAILTQRGERSLQPQLGSRIREFLFRPLLSALKIEIKNEISETILKAEPRVELLDVDLTSDKLDRSKFIVHLKYRIPSLQKVDQMRMAIQS